MVNHLLQNPDEIMPDGYNINADLKNGMLMINPYLNNLLRYVPKMVSGTINFKSKGRNSLVANEMETLRTPNRDPGELLNDYYSRCLPEGNIMKYTALTKLTAAERIEGQINLLDEQPTHENYMQPIYNLKDENVNPYEIVSDYKAICQIAYTL